jgi:hypothetical protein
MAVSMAVSMAVPVPVPVPVPVLLTLMLLLLAPHLLLLQRLALPLRRVRGPKSGHKSAVRRRGQAHSHAEPRRDRRVGRRRRRRSSSSRSSSSVGGRRRARAHCRRRAR